MSYAPTRGNNKTMGFKCPTDEDYGGIDHEIRNNRTNFEFKSVKCQGKSEICKVK